MQSFTCSTIKLKFEDIDKVRSLNNTIDPSLTLEFFNINRIYTDQAHDKIESILEISFTFAFIFLTPHDIWNAGKKRSQPCTEVFNLSILQLKSSISNP